MSLRAGFAEVDITPPLGTLKIGWTTHLVAERILDPLYTRVAVFENDSRRIGFVSLDLLAVNAEQTAAIRHAAQQVDIPAENLMVAATHNHAGPATQTLGTVQIDQRYVAGMLERVSRSLARAVANLQPTRIGIGSALEGRISFVRRFLMRDGSVKCHPRHSDQIRCAESVIDPEVGVLCAKDTAGNVLGFLVNFTCHPTHHGGDTAISAGYPGQLAMALKQAYGPACVPLFLNGAFGNIHHANHLDPTYKDDMATMGRCLAEDVQRVMKTVSFADVVPLIASSKTFDLPLRDIDGPYGAAAMHRQPFFSEDSHREEIARLRARVAQSPYKSAEVQCLRFGDDTAFVSIPAEYFCDMGLHIKAASRIARTLIVGAANGMLGYVPSRRAFDGGGYETTLAGWSRMHENTADALADTALDLLGRR